MLIIASISFLLPPTLTIQHWWLLIQIKYTFIYLLRGICLILVGFYKSWKCLVIRGPTINVLVLRCVL
ncbi:hypothetical protein D8682_17185 [Buttiauxella sp. 3AFRM03]|nr:hypothetical protein D8682_17185 [Buttiauxella sp. 3AFRM03]